MRELTDRERVELIKWAVMEGIDLQYGKLSLCDLRNYRYSNIRDDRKYQVHSEDRRYPWSGIYDDLDPAARKFLELRRRVRRMH